MDKPWYKICQDCRAKYNTDTVKFCPLCGQERIEVKREPWNKGKACPPRKKNLKSIEQRVDILINNPTAGLKI